MGWHQKCEYSNKCSYGSNTESGTCGYTSCRRETILNAVKDGSFTSLEVLESTGQISKKDAYHLYRKYIVGY